MDYKIRKIQPRVRGWHAIPLLFEWGENLRDVEAVEDVYKAFEEAKAEVIEMRKRGKTKGLVVVGLDENGMVRSYYPDKWRW